ncbi:MAG TPA: 5-formyltetrahydrofolate cyclo-ligase [Firmicutes bacterium]|nr:5-formyltetrahydrofolate cyclo-ligase [Bacillota bacterium]
MDKQHLRTIFRKKRDNIPPKKRREYSNTICRIFNSVFYFKKNAAVVCYLHTQSEVSTSVIIRKLLASGCRVYAPCVVNGKIKPRRITSKTIFKKGPYGIKEPVSGRSCISPIEADAVIMPGIAFDPKGNRLGFGAGYFDVFLSRLRKNTLKTALAFNCQLAPKIPKEKHDIKTDFIITEKGIIDCGKKIKP